MASDKNGDDPSPQSPSVVDTVAFEPEGNRAEQQVRRFRLTVLRGPKAGQSWESGTDRCSIGSHPSNDLVIQDPTVSRFHCEVQIAKKGACVHDLDSLNGTVIDGVQVKEGYVRNASTIRMGATSVQFNWCSENNPLPLSKRSEFGSLVGTSAAMRTVFALLERAAETESTVLLEGETGTGKGQMAQAIHKASARKNAPLLTIDCSSIPATLLESELFGHEKGAFSGALERRLGMFESANGGTVFLDEIGEMPPELQPKLLRVLEDRVIRRVGLNREQPVDVRVIAATNRDLRTEVNLGRFRSDLYFRVAVVKIAIPPLRQHPEDIELLVGHILKSLGADDAAAEPFRSQDFIAQLRRSAWPGNVRELRNYLERCLVFHDAPPVAENLSPSSSRPSSNPGSLISPVSSNLPFADARKLAMDQWEKRYLEELMAAHGGKVLQAAAAAGISRVYLYKLLVRHGLKK
ncbi:MAG: sigma 54-interacting transcriptional regulator [Polyangiaceae bacterium]|nr:sigma 54-interacting transcriptional regulator [Polyangiaceae bacterium]